MSSLQVALGALAIGLLIVVYAVSKWQERRALRRLQESMRGPVGDALMTPGAAPAKPVAAPASGSRIEPTFGPLPETRINAAVEDAPRADEIRPLPSGWTEDPLLDCTLELRCAHAVDGVAVIDAAAPLARLHLPLPVHLVAWDGRTQQWVAPDRFGFYSELLASVQLANRRHTLTEIEASQFISAVQQVALALDADFDPPDARRMLELATDLDRLCARFDTRIGLTLEPRDGPRDLERVAEATAACGLARVEAQRWQSVDTQGGAMFSVSAANVPVDRLTIELDVPRVAPAARPLRVMHEAALGLAQALDAQIVDDNRRPVQPESIAAIERQLAALYEEMLAAGIEPGSPRAQRLYV